MEGPGGYQLVGRTVQMWNSWRETANFGKPWLLRFFDRLRFYPVSAEELLEAREAFPHGQYDVKVEDGTFRLSDYFAFLEENAQDIAAFRVSQRHAFEEERRRWEEQGLAMSAMETEMPALEEVAEVPDGGQRVEAGVPGNVWSIGVRPGDEVAADQTLVVLESMKMEIEVRAPVAARVHEIHCTPGKMVQAGQPLVTLVPIEAEVPKLEAAS